MEKSTPHTHIRPHLDGATGPNATDRATDAEW